MSEKVADGRKVIIIAGPNGAGKTTFALEYLAYEPACRIFVNADQIASGVASVGGGAVAFRAGRRMLAEIDNHARQRRSFAFETTLSGRSYAKRIRQWRAVGYMVELIYLPLASSDEAVKRVKQRVRQGGHSIPEEIVRRRFRRSQRNFSKVYKQIVDSWKVVDARCGHTVVIQEGCQSTKGPKRRIPFAKVGVGGGQAAPAAMKHAVERAYEAARQHGTTVLAVRGGTIVEVDPRSAIYEAGSMRGDEVVEAMWDPMVKGGLENREVLRLAENWCAHLEARPFGGVGLVERATGLPIAGRLFRCRYARESVQVSTDVRETVLAFYDANCDGCDRREAVRFPNLTQLVGERDKERRLQDRMRAAARDGEESARRRRAERREKVKGAVGPTRKGLVDLIAQLDDTPSAEVAQRFVGAVKASPSRFEGDLKELLYEVLEAGGDERVEPVLCALDALEEDRPRLGRAALGAVARGNGTRVAADIGTRSLEGVDSSYVEAALGPLVRLAVGRFLHDAAALAEPLKLAYESSGTVVSAHLRRLLLSHDENERELAGAAICNVAEIDVSLARELTSELIKAAMSPVTGEAFGTSTSASSRALATVLREFPSELDEELRAAAARATVAEKRRLLDVLDGSIRSANADQVSPEVRAIAMKHAVDFLSQSSEIEGVDEAADLVGLVARDHPVTVSNFSEALLGCAAIQASILTAASPLAGTGAEARPKEGFLAELDRQRAVAACVEAVAEAAGSFPKSAGSVLLGVLHRLDEGSDVLKAAIVEGLGRTCRTREGLAIALPFVYGAMVAASARVRAAAVRAYSGAAQAHGSDLPHSVHEVAVAMLRDPYVVVHQSALRNLRLGTLPSDLQDDAWVAVVGLLGVYRRPRKNDGGFSGEVVKCLVSTFADRLKPHRALVAEILSVLEALEPVWAWDALRYCRQLQGVPGYAETLVSQISDPRRSSVYSENLLLQLVDLSQEEIRRVADRLAVVATEARKGVRGGLGRVDPTDELVEVLSRVGAWEEAQEVAQRWSEELAESDWHELHLRLRADRLVAATRLERTLGEGTMETISTCIKEWHRVHEGEHLAPGGK